MKQKIFKPTLCVLITLAAFTATSLAQDTITPQQQPEKPSVSNRHELRQKMNDLGVNLSMNVNSLVNNIVARATDIAPRVNLEIDNYKKELNLDIEPKIDLDLNNLVKDLDIDINPKINLNLSDNGNGFDDNQPGQENSTDDARVKEKVKTYSKSYPLDANDRINLSNQFGKISVNTWDKHEVKVDVLIKASAEDDDQAQKLLDGVQIKDSKDGDEVSFKTNIERNNGSWKIWSSGRKMHKVEIDYTVYMPVKTDLNVENSYGAIELPDLDGKVRINCSYGSTSAQNLSNPANEIEGSYGSLKAGSINGAHLDFSYGSADIDVCNNLKADLSYGSFKLGKLTGSADLDVSYEGGVKIDELGPAFKRLNVDASYSGVSFGVGGSNNFGFDITTTYGGFDYDDNKVTVTSKTPPDGSKHIGPTRNYKGYFGKDNSDARINIHTSYGGVKIE